MGNNLSCFFNKHVQSQLAWDDFWVGLRHWRLWITLAYQDIKLRYRRSTLGPFWLTLSMAITVYTIGYLYSYILHVDMKKYYLFLVSGMLGWFFLSSLIIDSSEAFLASSGLIKQIKLSYSLHIHRAIFRNYLIFFHNILVIIPLYIYFHEEVKINTNTLLLIPSLIVIYFNAIFWGTLLALISTRYSDIVQVTKSLLQILFFLTPVMWFPEILQGKQTLIVTLNPLYAFLECMREPLLGNPIPLPILITISVTTLIGSLLSTFYFIKFRSSIVYWL